MPRVKGGGDRPTTVGDARKLGLLPSVTTILRVLNAPALNAWKIEQAVLSVLTAPRLENETTDDFVARVMATEMDEEAKVARQLGTDIHDAISTALGPNGPVPEHLAPYVLPVLAFLNDYGRVSVVEQVVIGDGYAGRVDCITTSQSITVWDFKSAKKLPPESWTEHRLQLAAYAKTLGNVGDTMIRTGNIYISTTEPGKIAVHLHDDWPFTFVSGFKPLLEYWRWVNKFTTSETPT